MSKHEKKIEKLTFLGAITFVEKNWLKRLTQAHLPQRVVSIDFKIFGLGSWFQRKCQKSQR